MEDYEYRSYSPSLSFMKDLLVLADMANEIGSDHLDFDIGSMDGITMNVEISFNYRREDPEDESL